MAGQEKEERRGHITISSELNKSIIQLLYLGWPLAYSLVSNPVDIDGELVKSLGWAVEVMGAHAPSWIDPIWEQEQGMHLLSSCYGIVSGVRADMIRVWPYVAVSGWQLCEWRNV